MCGICGISSPDPNYPIDSELLVSMRDTMVPRGPDDAGVYIRGGIGLGARRLAIIDLSMHGHMPMETLDGRFCISYNGEVYNYRELGSELKSRGYEFRSKTDTEVILNAYAEFGTKVLERLNGMFAFAVWDHEKRVLFLARDRLGVKPLFYALKDGVMYFASEPKALFAAGVPREFDPEVWEELLCFRYVAGERTPYKGIKRLLPGHYLTWQNGRIQIHRWWNLSERIKHVEPPTENTLEWFRTTFEDSVLRRQLSDVPVGVLLSGGLDSCSVASTFAKQAGEGVSSFTVRFAEANYDEGALAQEVARRWHLNYHDLTVKPEELPARLHAASRLNDEPLAHGSDLHIWAISQMAKSHVTVLLSGEGADEILGGYVRYRPLLYPGLLRAARPFLPGVVSAFGLNGRLKKLSRFLELGNLENFVLFNSCDVLPVDLQSLGFAPKLEFSFRRRVLSEAAQVYPGSLLRQTMYSDQHTFLCSILDRNDRMTKGASIECRVPFLDYRLVEGLAALPTSTLCRSKPKWLLRSAFENQLPHSVLQHRKWGFAVPWTKYLREVPLLRARVENIVNDKPVKDGPFDRKSLSAALKQFFAGDNQHEALIRQLLMINIWYDACFAAPGQPTSDLRLTCETSG